jgi:hypothetical protein
MTIALSAKVTIDPKRLITSRWVHDTAHAVASLVRQAKDRLERGIRPKKR